MKFHKEGRASLLLAVLFAAIIILIAHYFFPASRLAHWFAYILGGSLVIIILQFFRHPPRQVNAGETYVLAPADGKVVVIEETEEGEVLKDRRIQVSIFMSPINVHVNRYPVSGMVSYFKYHPGKFLTAWQPKSSTDNERTTVVIKQANGTQVLFRQIAGALARRIVWYCKEGDKAEQGGEMGFIKFGSRVDVFLPLQARILVKAGQVVKGAQTVIAEV
jgi:phosphatidylserine decarboxylase